MTFKTNKTVYPLGCLSVLFVGIAVPVIYVFSWLYWEGGKQKKFQKAVRAEFESYNIPELHISVCHEWKCIITYKDESIPHKYLIFGQDNYKERLNAIKEIYKEPETSMEKCRFVQPGSRTCQL